LEIRQAAGVGSFMARFHHFKKVVTWKNFIVRYRGSIIQFFSDLRGAYYHNLYFTKHIMAST